MSSINRPSNGIRELAAGMEDVIFGRGGYYWFLEENAREFARNRMSDRRNVRRTTQRLTGPKAGTDNTNMGKEDTPMGSRISDGYERQAREEIPDRTLGGYALPTTTGEKNQQQRTSSRRTSVRSKGKAVELRPRRSSKTPVSTTASSTPTLDSSDGDYDDGSGQSDIEMATDDDDDGEDDDDDDEGEEEEEDEDEIESVADKIQEPRSQPVPSTSYTHDAPLGPSSPTFPLTRVRDSTSCPPSRGSSEGRRPATNRMYVDLTGLPKIPTKSPKKVGMLEGEHEDVKMN